jgi:hypothetical protein
MNIIFIFPAIVVLIRCVCVSATFSKRNWTGHQLQFAFLSASYALIAGGALGVAVGWHLGPACLLFGVAGMILFDRRIRT